MPPIRLKSFHPGPKRLRPSSLLSRGDKTGTTDLFGNLVFGLEEMKKRLPKPVVHNLLESAVGNEKIKEEYADTIATALKEWAIEQGATHFSHWFQPLTGSSAEKHDSFLAWNRAGEKPIEIFSGKQLIQGEPDASSFPSGGLRSTYEARGYTGWDPSSPPFLWLGGDGVTLCVPSVFFSWTGQVLDGRIPLLRSETKLNKAVQRLLKLTGVEANHTFPTLGLEQEYFIIDKTLRDLRPDLVILGKTIQGAPAAKGQELQDHYFGAVKDRILAYMRDFEEMALRLSIPVKTRHNEVAPAQYEVAPLFERASLAIDHNMLLMEVMKQMAEAHHLSCLLHEKPFAKLNGSGKHSNWSITTDQGLNLLDPFASENNLHFFILLIAILKGIHRHNGLLRAAIGSASNDDRLGGHEAPPSIISVYLGEELEKLLDQLLDTGLMGKKGVKQLYDLGLISLAHLSRDQADRNRTSPFAYTGGKFEFRAVGSSQNPSLAIAMLNAIVAESLIELLDEYEKRKSSNKTVLENFLPILQEAILSSKSVRFSGDNYSQEWIKEAERRGLKHFDNSVEAFMLFKTEAADHLFKEILTPEELQSRLDILLEFYVSEVDIEAKLLIDLFRTNILPAAIKTELRFAEAIKTVQEALRGKKELHHQSERLEQIVQAIETAILEIEMLEAVRNETATLSLQDRAKRFATKVRHQIRQARQSLDQLETVTDDDLWPIPKYRELLYLF